MCLRGCYATWWYLTELTMSKNSQATAGSLRKIAKGNGLRKKATNMLLAGMALVSLFHLFPFLLTD